MTGAGFPHSDILGSTLGWQLPEAYRSLPRPSSAPGAQASTVCPYQLGHTQTPPHTPTRTTPHPATPRRGPRRRSRHERVSSRDRLPVYKKLSPSLAERDRAKRCSRPLCSSQRTNSDPPTDPTSPPAPRPRRDERRRGMRPGRPCHEKDIPRPPVARAAGSAPSGPNSVPTTTTPPDPLPHTPQGGAVLGAGRTGGRTGQRSTLEHHPTHIAHTR